ncbi:MAG TPA: Gfo/Idh/MocA family oxidoreductase, partial [Phycisphaerae bacterium]|nr:Gfo/Idh/MocA family oxidoreductase [Phycisphaerae bacterium]
MRTTAAAGAMALSARNVARAAGANERLTTAFIGCGHIAKFGHLKELGTTLLKEGKLTIPAACDVYKTRAVEFQGLAKEAGQDVKLVGDYHEILAMKDIDYVTIATPEHWHAKMAIEALEAGKHVYVEKPMTHTVEQAL